MKKLTFLLLCVMWLSPIVLGADPLPVDDLDVYGQICFKDSNGVLEYCLPMVDGTDGQVLKTNGNGTITFGNASDLGLTIDPSELNATNSLVDNYVPSYDLATGQFTWIEMNSAVWGNITGTLSNQTDLQSALDLKLDVLSAFSGSYTDLTDKPTNFSDDDVTNDNVESMTTIGANGTSPISDGAGNLVMRDVVLQSEIDSESELESIVGVDILTSADDLTITTEQIEDAVVGLINDEDSVHTLINFTYDDMLGALSAAIDDDLSLYDNSTAGFLTAADLNDDSPTNELQNLFSTFSVSGQNDIVASSQTDTLTLIAGTNITLLTDAPNKTVEIISADIPPDDWEDITNKPVTAYGVAFDNTDLVAGVLTVIHELNEQYVVVAIYDNNGNTVIPDTIDAVDVDTLTVDLTSWGTISGTWYARVVIAGGDVNFGTYVLTVSELDGSPSVANVEGIKFNQDSGFILTDNGDDTVTVSLGSHFKTIQVAGQDDIVASGEDTLIIAEGDNTTITTNAATNTLTITATSGAGGDEKSKVSANDTTAGYLNGKLVAGINITLTESNDGGDEILTISADSAALSDSIDEGDSHVEVVDNGDGHIKFIEDGTEIGRITGGSWTINNATPSFEIIDSTDNGSFEFTRTDVRGEAIIYNDLYRPGSSETYALNFDGIDVPGHYTSQLADIAVVEGSSTVDNLQAPFSLLVTFKTPASLVGNNMLAAGDGSYYCSPIAYPKDTFYAGWTLTTDGSRVVFRYKRKVGDITSATFTSGNILSVNTVHYLMFVLYDSETAYVMLDGTQYSMTRSGGLTGSIGYDSGRLMTIGGSQAGFFPELYHVHSSDMVFDEVALFNTDKRTFYNTWYNGGATSEVPAETTGLVGLWRFNEGTGSILADSSTSNAYATLYTNGSGDEWIPSLVSPPANLRTKVLSVQDGVDTDEQGIVTLTAVSTDGFYYGEGNIDFQEINFKISGTTELSIGTDGGIHATSIKTGTTQVGSGAIAGELWVDTDDDYTLKLGQ